MTNEDAIWELPTNHDRLAEHIKLAGREAVDVGSGAGALVRFMRSEGANAIGVECGAAMIDQARAADPDHHDRYVDGVGQDLPLNDETADLVVFSYSLHHVPIDHMAAALGEAERVLRPGGELVVMEPIPEGPGFETHKPIDDETVVRTHAQQALDQQRPASLNETSTVTYTTSYSYRDVAELEKTMIDIDPKRREAFDGVRDDIEARFSQHGEEHGGRTWFRQPVLMRVFEKAAAVTE